MKTLDDWLNGLLRDCDEMLTHVEQSIQDDRLRQARRQLTPGASQNRESKKWWEGRRAALEQVKEKLRG